MGLQQGTSPLIHMFTYRLESKPSPPVPIFDCLRDWASLTARKKWSKAGHLRGAQVSLERYAEGTSLNVHSLKNLSYLQERQCKEKKKKLLYLCHEFCAGESISGLTCARDSVPAVNSWGTGEEKEAIFPHAQLKILLADLQARGGGRDCCSFPC